MSQTPWTWGWAGLRGCGDGRGSLPCCSPWGLKSQTQLSNWTKLNWSEGDRYILMDGQSHRRKEPLIMCQRVRDSLAGQSIKNLPAMQETGVKKIPLRRKWQPTPVFLPGESHGQRSLAGYSPWVHKSLTQLSDETTKELEFLQDNREGSERNQLEWGLKILICYLLIG